MNIQELQKQIINKEFDNLYIFLGEEIAIQKIYINMIAQKTGLELQYVEDIKSVYNKLLNRLYVILDDIEFTKQEKIFNELNYKIGDNIIIFKFNSLDKRSKFYKQFENRIVEFNKLSDEVLTKYIQKETSKDIPLSNINCKKLIDICNSNYNQILFELDKINQLKDIYYINSYDYVFEQLEKQGAFHKEISDITFTFIDKVVTRDIKAVYELQKKLKQINESNIKLLSLLYNNIKTVLLVQSCKSDDICKTTGLQYYQVKYNINKVGYYSTGELVHALRLIQKIESGIKTGEIDEQISLDYLLINIL